MNIEVALDEMKHCRQVGNITFQMPQDEETIDTIIKTLENQLDFNRYIKYLRNLLLDDSKTEEHTGAENIIICCGDFLLEVEE